MSWQLYIANHARKSLLGLPKASASRLLKVLDEINEDPYCGDIKKIKGEVDTWRRRVGHYRIVYKVLVNERMISVTMIETKSDNTY
ncbi:MAG: type II toxin-antitoxin system RelE/ParE family toxin [Patescibacteria group bacterium]